MPEDRNLGKRCSVVQFIFFYTIAVLAIGLALLVTMALTGCQHKDNASSSKITAEMALREYTIFSSSMLYAVIKGRHEYERYDFSDELKYDEEMWEIVKGKFDEFEYSHSFALIDRDEFLLIWNKTKRCYTRVSDSL